MLLLDYIHAHSFLKIQTISFGVKKVKYASASDTCQTWFEFCMLATALDSWIAD